MKKLSITFCLCVLTCCHLNAQTFTSLEAFGSNKKIEWTTSTYGNGYGHKIFSYDPGGMTLLNFAARNGSTSWTNLMTLTSTGMVGIGTSSPETLLNIHVGSGGANSVAGFRIGGFNNYASLELGIDGDYDGMVRSFGNNLKYYAGHWRIIGNVASEDHSHNWYTSKAGSANWSDVKMILNQDGNLGLGTASPDAKLTVKGNIHTQEVKVDLLGAVVPDYVFHADYDLKTLKSVEDYIANYGHLPNIPSAKDMETEGIMLKEMNLKLLEKIEELTLYAIDQEKRIDTLEAESKTLKTQEEQIAKLEEKITLLLSKN